MVSKAEEYRRKAEEAAQSANAAHDLGAKRMYEEIAEHYRYLARQQENTDRYTMRSEG